jgi:hypothetical protein
MVKKEKVQNSIIKVVAGRDFLSHKILRRPTTATPKNKGDDLMIGIDRILNCSMILVIEMGAIISDGMIKVQKNIWAYDPVIKQKTQKIANGIK